MSNCGPNKSINKTFIIEPLELSGGSPTLSACTTLFTNLIESCSGNTSILLTEDVVIISGDTEVLGNITASTIDATTYLSGGTNIIDIISTGSNTFITGFTYDDSNNLTITRNDGVPLSVNLSVMSALTINGNLSVTGDVSLSSFTATTSYLESIETVDYIQFNTDYTGNTILEGRIYWDEDNGTLSLGMHGGNVHQQIGQELFYYIKNQSGATIENGKVVKAAGTLGASGRILGEYMIGDGSVPAKFTLGVATEDIPNGEDGYVTEFGLVRGIDTTGGPYGETWNDGDILWVSPTFNGGLTNIHPVAPNLHVEMAIVINSAVNGSIFVRPHRYPNFHDLQEAGWSGGTENDLDVIQWNGTTGLFELTNTPLFNSLSAVTISADTYYGDGSNLTGIIGTDNFYATAATLYNNVVYFDRTDTLSAFTVDLSSLVTSGSTDIYTTGTTLVGNIAYFDTNDTLSAYTLDLSTIAPSGGTGDDFYTTGVTIDGSTLYFDRNDTLSAYTVNLSGITVSGENIDTIMFTGSRDKANQNNIFLRQDDGTPYNIIPYRVYNDGTITDVVASGRDLDTWQAHILTGTSIATDSIYNLLLSGEDNKYDDSVNLDVSSGDTLYLYVSGTSISYPTINVYLKKR